MIESSELQRPSVSTELRRANQAFARDLPKLIKRHRGKWAAYIADERKGIADDRDTLFRKFRREYEEGVLLLAKIRERAAVETVGF